MVKKVELQAPVGGLSRHSDVRARICARILDSTHPCNATGKPLHRLRLCLTASEALGKCKIHLRWGLAARPAAESQVQ